MAAPLEAASALPLTRSHEAEEVETLLELKPLAEPTDWPVEEGSEMVDMNRLVEVHGDDDDRELSLYRRLDLASDAVR